MSDNIHVAVRMRPLISREIESKAAIHWNTQQSTIYQTNSPNIAFQFDRVFQGHENNETVYSEFCSPIVKSVIDGFNGTIFAYGQTSSGKTFTMMGDDDGKTLGVIHFTISDIFKFIQDMPERDFLLRVSYMEIYNEMVRDLLSDKNDKNENLKLHEDQYGLIKVSGLSEHTVQEADQVLRLMRQAERKRRTGETRMNEKSSRSHSIFRMIIESGLKRESDAAVNVSQFNLVDLAGSERARQTGAIGTRFKESVNINKSLLMLSNVISQLSEKGLNDQFVNYRDSKLTRILQNSLGGNARTAIICTVTPACLDETVSTLKFAERAKSIKNKPEVNEVLTEQAVLKQYANEIKKLTKELEATKVEKAQENRSLQEQIQNLKKKFVSQMAPEIKSRSNRRETWGGCLDTARIRLDAMASRRPLVSSNLSILEEDKSRIPRRSFTPQKLMPPFEERSSLPGPACNEQLFSELTTVEEESELGNDSFDCDDFAFEPLKYCPKPSYICSQQTDAIVQTELDLPNLLSLQSEKQQMSEEILSLKKELEELQDFTTLERQLLRAKNRLSLESKSRLSLDLTITEMDKTENISMACKIPTMNSTLLSSVQTKQDKNVPKTDVTIETDIIDCSDVFYSNSPKNKEHATSQKYENDNEIFDYLDHTIRILGNRMKINPTRVEDNLNTKYKIMLDMFNMILQYQCFTFKGSFKTVLTEKISDISQNLNEIFQAFSNNSSSDENEELVEGFMEKTDDILKEIEMCFVDPDDGKHGILNQSLNPESFLQLHSFEDSVVNVSNAKSPRFTPLKTIFESSPNSQIDMVLGDTSIVGGVRFNDVALRERLSALERDIEEYRKSISDIKSENELKDKQLEIFKDKVEVQEQIINGLKDELTLLVDNKSASNINEIARFTDSSSQTLQELSNAVLKNNEVTLVSCCTQTLDEMLNIMINDKASLVENYSQTESQVFVNGDSQTDSQTFVDGYPPMESIVLVSGHSQTESPTFVDGYSQMESLTFVDGYSQMESVVLVNGQSQTESPTFVSGYSQTESLAFANRYSETVFETSNNIPSKNVECSDYYSQIEDSSVLACNYSQTTDDLCNAIPSNCNDVFSDGYSKTKDLSNVSPKNEKVFTDCSSQTSEDLLKFLPNITTLANASCQTTDLLVLRPFCDKLSSDQCTQTFNSCDILPSTSRAYTSADCPSKANNFRTNDLPNLNLEDARNVVTVQDMHVIDKISNCEDDQHVNTKEEAQSEMEAQIKVTLNDLIELRIFALEFMKRDMKNFLGDIEFFENNESSPLLDQIKIEITALKELLVRFEFYIKYQNEHNEHFNTVLEENNYEKFTLKEQLDKLESITKEKDAEYLSFCAALLDMEKSISELIQNVRKNEIKGMVEPFVKWSETNCSIIDKNTPISHIKSLQKMILNVDSIINEKLSSMMNLSEKLQETEDKLKSLQHKNRMPLRVTKSVQTSGENKLLQISKKLEEADICVEDLKKEINNLTTKLEKICNEKKLLENYLEISNNKMKEMSEAFEEEKLSWTESTMECVRRVEEKCDQMMVEQENRFFDDINKLKLEQRLQLLEKSKSYRAEQEEFKRKIEDLKKEHQKNLTEINDKLDKEVEDRYSEKCKLENEIRALEESLCNVKQLNSIMKEKYRKYSSEYQRLKAKLTKSVQEKETQTKEEISKMSVQTKVMHNPIYVPEEKSKPCHNCAVLMQKISDLQKSRQNENLDIAGTEKSNMLKKELYDLKADMSSLKRNNNNLVKENMSLKQDLSSKLNLLRSCRCRLNPMPLINNPDVLENPAREGNYPDDVKSAEIRKENLSNPTDILNNEIVQRAIEEARLQERAVLNSGNGPDGTVKCHYLMRKLNKKEKELEQKNKELESFKNKLGKKQTFKRHAAETLENEPVNAFEGRHLLEEKKFTSKANHVHPFPDGEIPKVQPKKILKEVNRKVGISNQDNVVQNVVEKKGIMSDFAKNCVPIFDTSSMELMKKNKIENKGQEEQLHPKENKTKDREEERRRQIEMLTGAAPDCKQQ